ncbi:hypothetical protein [Actinomarinicola tropica]|uniref:FHA domain-containing protein n=1 Tax=Actinomarinicola tropica TaxID=2789776 RepID=A0A5Q2RG97_9ACTN|nr:hypothetical protein [Actinomarinicola tropica]QGG93631.1 hypothetical protein GH723_00060 [Actinomarinicola tropica]
MHALTSPLRIEYCGEWYAVDPDERFTIGRTADLSVDDNPYLHRHFLELRCESGVWLLANVGKQLSATVGDEQSQLVAHVAPGGVVPLVVQRTRVRFGAGPTTYEVLLVLPDAPFTTSDDAVPRDDGDLSTTTRAPAVLTPDQRIVVLALAEHALGRTGSGPSALPTSADAARRVGWSERKFNKKLDQVCQKLAKAGVRGLHGGPGDIAANRRARLVEYCLTSRVVTEDDLPELDRAAAVADGDDD